MYVHVLVCVYVHVFMCACVHVCACVCGNANVFYLCVNRGGSSHHHVEHALVVIHPLHAR